MMSYRRASLGTPLLCLIVLALASSFPSLLAQQAGQKPPVPPPVKPKPANPFENIPQNTPVEAPKPEPQAPAKPKLENPAQPVPEAAPAVATPAVAPADTPAEDVIEAIEFRGSRRVPQDTLRALIISKKGDRYSEDSLNRDFMALWNTSRFDDIRLEREAGRTGWVIRFVVTERRVVRSIKYDGMKSITVSEILDRFKERKVAKLSFIGQKCSRRFATH